MNDPNIMSDFSDLVGEFNVPISLLVVCQEKEERFKQELIKKSGVLKEDIFEISPNQDEKKPIIAIKQSRELIHWLSLKPQGEVKIAFVHRADLLNTEAANALLKIIEEMPKQAVLVLFMPKLNVLSTIKSRCRIIRIAETVEIKNQHKNYITAFLSQSFAKQSISIDEIVKNGKTEQFLISLEEWARSKMLEEKSLKYINYTEQVFNTKRNILNNANSKLALENLVLSFRK